MSFFRLSISTTRLQEAEAESHQKTCFIFPFRWPAFHALFVLCRYRKQATAAFTMLMIDTIEKIYG